MRRVFLALLFAQVATTARATIVYLKEGGALTGALVSATAAEVVLDTSQGRVRIDMARVRNIDATTAAPAAPPSAPAPTGDVYQPEQVQRGAADEALFEPRAQVLSIDLGLASPMSSIGFSGTAGGGKTGNGDVGPAIGFQYLYFSSPRIGWGLEFHNYDRAAASSTNPLPSADSRVFGDTVLLLGVVKISLTERGAVRPFILLGAGAHRTTTVIDSRPFAGYAWSDTGTDEPRRLIDGSAVGPAASVRLGLDFGFADPTVFGLEAGWTGLASARYGATDQGQALGITGAAAPLNYFTFAGRWGFSF